MKELRESFDGEGEVRGYHFECLFRDGYAYMYEVSMGDYISHYEVFERRENRSYDCVSYPRSRSFGSWAFTYRSYDEAYARFLELSSRVRSREE